MLYLVLAIVTAALLVYLWESHVKLTSKIGLGVDLIQAPISTELIAPPAPDILTNQGAPL